VHLVRRALCQHAFGAHLDRIAIKGEKGGVDPEVDDLIAELKARREA